MARCRAPKHIGAGSTGARRIDARRTDARRVDARLEWRFPRGSDSMSIEDRLIEIEIKLTSQDDLTQELNHMVYQQQKQIDELRLLCTALVKRLGESGGEGGEPDAGTYTQEKPPHY